MCPSWVTRHCSACVRHQDVQQSFGHSHYDCWETIWLRSFSEFSAWNKLPESRRRVVWEPLVPSSPSLLFFRVFMSNSFHLCSLALHIQTKRRGITSYRWQQSEGGRDQREGEENSGKSVGQRTWCNEET